MIVLAVAILGMCMVLAAMCHKQPHIQFMPEAPKKKIQRGERYETMIGSDALVTGATARGYTGFIIHAGFISPLRTHCEWDANGRALTQTHAYDLKVEN